MFKELPGELDFPKMERRILKFWSQTDAFNKLREKNRGNKRFSFLDGPITANNPMGVHHAWGRTYKDIFQRYKAMQGCDQRYQNGFDCQGLWVEVEVEKELGFNSKLDIEKYGIANFVQKCKERVRKYAAIQTQESVRLGYWMDWDNSYYTMSDKNNYSIWHFLKKCHQNGWIYKGTDVMPWCPRCGTALSEHEIVTEGYKEIAHRSPYVKFTLKDRPNEHLLVWTTTPWTLTSNVAAAVHPEMTYVKVKQGDDYYYLARSRLDASIDGDFKVVEEMPGRKLSGLTYSGPFDDLPRQNGVEHRVIAWKEVSETEGTGIVHIAPGCGKEDFALSKEHDLEVIAPLDEFGNYIAGFEWLVDKNAQDTSEKIIEDLQKRGILYKVEDYTHRYPVCWRCDSELVFRLVDEWFIYMDELRYKIMDVSKKIRWIPDFGLERELDWLKNMHDWCISKKRYWGLALPIYECDCGHFDVIGSKEELEERAVGGWEDFEGNSPHRPWVDAVVIECRRCKKKVSRIKDVGNPWLDAGIVAYSTLNYRGDREYWDRWFPADFITESFAGQFRNWFYSLLAMSTVLENREPFRTVLGHAQVRDERSEEMHKSKGNAIWFKDAAEKMGVDVMRWIFSLQNPVINLNFGYSAGDDAKRELLTLWNTVKFFITYANLDKYDPKRESPPVDQRHLLDRWIISKLNLLIFDSVKSMDDYNTASVVRGARDFIDELSNWYVRRSRRRFWKSENDTDKLAAYTTLYESISTLSKILAPVLPFLSEEIYQSAVRFDNGNIPESVHHCEYPRPDESLIEADLMDQMRAAIRVTGLGRSIRNNTQLKIRQPLSEFLIVFKDEATTDGLGNLEGIVKDELNVKEIKILDDPVDLVRYSIKPNFSALGPKYGNLMPKIKAALESVDGSDAVDRLKSGSDIQIEVGGEKITITPEEAEVEISPREGMAVAEDQSFLVALDTRLSDGLISEGFAREFVHKVQNMRKACDFEVSDRIKIKYRSSDKFKSAIANFGEYIKTETLCINLEACDVHGLGAPQKVGAPPCGDSVQKENVNGQDVIISVERIL